MATKKEEEKIPQTEETPSQETASQTSPQGMVKVRILKKGVSVGSVVFGKNAIANVPGSIANQMETNGDGLIIRGVTPQIQEDSGNHYNLN